MLKWLIHQMGGRTEKEYQQSADMAHILWEANKKLVSQNQDLHNRLQMEKIEPVKRKRGRPRKVRV